MGLLSAALRVGQAKKLEQEILYELRRAEAKAAETGSPGIGVDIPMHGEKSDLYALALNRILTKYPQLAVMRFADHFTLAPRRSVRQTTSQACFDMLEDQGGITA